MNEQGMPPQSVFLDVVKNLCTTKHEGKKAVLILLPLTIHDRMNEELTMQSSDLQEFINEACFKHLAAIDAKRLEMQEYIAFNEMRITQNPFQLPEFDSSFTDSSDEVNMLSMSGFLSNSVKEAL